MFSLPKVMPFEVTMTSKEVTDKEESGVLGRFCVWAGAERS